MKYEIKDEVIDGDKATVDVEIQVRDYSNILSAEINQEDYLDDTGKYDSSKYYDDQLTKLEGANELVKYTITFNLTKKDNEWVIDDLDTSSMEKIHGIYVQ